MQLRFMYVLIFVLLFCTINTITAQTHQINSGITNLSILSYSDKSVTLDDYIMNTTFHNTVFYKYYNSNIMAKGIVIFPNFVGYKKPSESMKAINKITEQNINFTDPSYSLDEDTATSLTAIGGTFGISYTFNFNPKFELNLAVGPQLMIFFYSLFGLEDLQNSVLNENTKDSYFQPLNSFNFGLGLEGETTLNYFFNQKFGINLAFGSSVLSIFNASNFTERPEETAKHSYTDDRLAYTYTFSLGVSLKK